MPNIKKLRVSFDVDAPTLMRVLAENNTGFNIEAFEAAVEPKRQLEAAPLLLEDKSDMSLRDLVLQRLRHTGRPVKLIDLQSLALNNDHTTKQLGNLLFVLKQQRIILRSGPGLYRISKRHM